MKVFGHFDVEADGPTPMSGNMINIGIVFTTDDGNVIDELVCDLQKRDGIFGDKATLGKKTFKPDFSQSHINVEKLEWWSHPDRINEYNRICREALPYLDAMGIIDNKIKEILRKNGAKKFIWVARPASYDWMFFKCYYDLYRLSNANATDPGYSALCCSAYRNIWKELKGYDSKQEEEKFKEWAKGNSITHNGLDDARYQAAMFHGIVKELQALQTSSKL
jgi:hypothetical protein